MGMSNTIGIPTVPLSCRRIAVLSWSIDHQTGFGSLSAGHGELGGGAAAVAHTLPESLTVPTTLSRSRRAISRPAMTVVADKLALATSVRVVILPSLLRKGVAECFGCTYG